MAASRPSARSSATVSARTSGSEAESVITYTSRRPGAPAAKAIATQRTWLCTSQTTTGAPARSSRAGAAMATSICSDV